MVSPCIEVSRELEFVSSCVLEIILFALFWDEETKTKHNRKYASVLNNACILLVLFSMLIIGLSW